MMMTGRTAERLQRDWGTTLSLSTEYYYCHIAVTPVVVVAESTLRYSLVRSLLFPTVRSPLLLLLLLCSLSVIPHCSLPLLLLLPITLSLLFPTVRSLLLLLPITRSLRYSPTCVLLHDGVTTTTIRW